MSQQGSIPWSAPVRLALVLVAGTMLYNLVEAGVALWSGAVAGSSVLVGFGLDSIIESAAAAVVLWRLALEARGAGERAIERAETRVRRFVGATFLLLAVYVGIQGSWTLWQGHAPEESLIGVVLAIASLLIMPALAWGKLRVADRVGSGALRAEAKETLACSYLSFTLLLGLVLNAAAGWWWADPAAALLMVPWLVREGRENLLDEHCEDDGC